MNERETRAASAPSAQAGSTEDLEVAPHALRWRCDPAVFEFETTAEVEPALVVLGQEDAVEALRFGLEIDAPGQNVFVRGLTGTGRSTLLRRLLREIQPACPVAKDLCYVHNFERPERPRLIELPAGAGASFQARMDVLADFIRDKLAPTLSSSSMQERQESLEAELQKEMEALGEPFDQELRANGLALVTLRVGPAAVSPAIFPLVEGQPVPLEKVDELEQKGGLSAEEAQGVREKVQQFAKRFQELGRKLQEVQEKHRAAMRQLFESETRRILEYTVREIASSFPFDRVRKLLDEVIEDVIRHRAQDPEPGQDVTRRYRVNLILEHDPEEGCPIVVENTPTLHNLLGVIDRKVGPQGVVYTDHTMIGAGSILRANGGYLLLEARDVLSEPGAWKVLMRTLRTGRLEIVPHDSIWFGFGSLLKPEAIPIKVKVILLGDPGLYQVLDMVDQDFSHLFKVLADFDSSVAREEDGLRQYAASLARLSEEEHLPPFHRDAVAALAEHGARIAARQDRLTARFGRMGDIAREAAFLARKEGRDVVRAADVRAAVRRTKRRADLPARKFRELVTQGTIRIQTEGREVGQVNGLAVVHSGQLTYGFPARITATMGPGSAGAINIEREAQLSGAIHTKGFYILGGLLRHLLRTSHPLAFSASIAFEQSYGGIDGDSASGAEMCCLLSALTEVPLRQDLAMTGAIDQFGHVQAVGAVSEKIEGFFDTCSEVGLSGSQGVIVPHSNLRDLMLREDVVEACAEGRFHVYAVETIQQALELLTGRPAGEPDADGTYPEDTLLRTAVDKARGYWEMARKAPGGNRALEEE